MQECSLFITWQFTPGLSSGNLHCKTKPSRKRTRLQADFIDQLNCGFEVEEVDQVNQVEQTNSVGESLGGKKKKMKTSL